MGACMCLQHAATVHITNYINDANLNMARPGSQVQRCIHVCVARIWRGARCQQCRHQLRLVYSSSGCPVQMCAPVCILHVNEQRGVCVGIQGAILMV
jgi:hypothetical protein